MSTKIQILNEKQVDHYVTLLLPKLNDKFNAKVKELNELAEKQVNKFIAHEDVLKLKEEHAKKIEIAEKTVALTKQLKEISKDFHISRNGYYLNFITETEEELTKLYETQQEELDTLLLELSKKSLKVNDVWLRGEYMTAELRARLCMVAVSTFEEIQTKILSEINIDNFFTNKI